MPDQLIAINGRTFVIADRSGDISGVVHGLFVRDARYLSTWVLSVAGKRPRLLTSHHVDPYSSLCFLGNADASTLPPNSVSILRSRVVGQGMEEQWELTNHTSETLKLDVEL
ncbi:MAG: glycogen debranching N-terminal domain-containing protein, partial [Candidatus Dormibacteria bacterium]